MHTQSETRRGYLAWDEKYWAPKKLISRRMGAHLRPVFERSAHSLYASNSHLLLYVIYHSFVLVVVFMAVYLRTSEINVWSIAFIQQFVK